MWAITSYFNPASYRRKYENYLAFRRALEVPLVAVELVYGTDPELSENDAEILIQISGRDVLWQKERLLNVALEAVPSSATSVAWLDCDVLFERPDWAALTDESLKHHVLVQPFSEVFEMPMGGDSRTSAYDRKMAVHCGTAIAKRLGEDLSGTSIFELGPSIRSSGLAWAARREVLDTVGFYDSCILGGGDRALVAAAVGDFDSPAQHWQWNPRQVAHFREWAECFFTAVQGRIGFVEGPLIHLWHGDPEERRYRQRLLDLAAFDFDPFIDIAIGEGGCWRWNTPKEELRSYAARYFEERREDG
ncbi:MAG: hypothetical protein P8X82_04355 [Gemmatimonadales bacterium]|jgi:hypothetical protein